MSRIVESICNSTSRPRIFSQKIGSILELGQYICSLCKTRSDTLKAMQKVLHTANLLRQGFPLFSPVSIQPIVEERLNEGSDTHSCTRLKMCLLTALERDTS